MIAHFHSFTMHGQERAEKSIHAANERVAAVEEANSRLREEHRRELTGLAQDLEQVGEVLRATNQAGVKLNLKRVGVLS